MIRQLLTWVDAESSGGYFHGGTQARDCRWDPNV